MISSVFKESFSMLFGQEFTFYIKKKTLYIITSFSIFRGESMDNIRFLTFFEAFSKNLKQKKGGEKK